MATKIVTKNSSTASAVPTASDLVQGELAVNVADKRLFTEDNGGSIVELGTNPSGNVTFQDNGKAIFGAGSDLQIYHDGSNSWIKDEGTGVLALTTNGNGIGFYDPAGAEPMLFATKDNSVDLYFDGSKKLATTSTGIDVTGTATMDGLTVNTGSYGAVGAGSGRMYGSSTHGLVIQGSGTTNDFLFLGSDGSDSFKIANNGDISFYEDTGTTAKLFWDASAESLGIGTSAPSTALQVGDGTDTANWLRLTGTVSDLYIGQNPVNDSFGQTNAAKILSVASYPLAMGTANAYPVIFGTNDIERMRIDSSGRVGIGESDPFDKLVVRSSDVNSVQSALSLKNGDIGASAGAALNFVVDDANDVITAAIYGQRTASAYHQGSLQFLTRDSGGAGLNERMRIDASGNVGIGTSSPAAKLHVSNGSSGFEFSPDGISDGTSYMQVYDRVANSYDNLRYYAREHYFHCDNFEKMRLDNAGNLLVGTTSTSASVAGGRIFSTGRLVTSVNNEGHYFRRNSSDGSIVDFAKDGTTVGSIGAKGGTAYLIGSSKGLRVSGSGLIPITTAGANSDATYDIGDQAVRFKDLYLSGGVYLGGTGAANKLDDYEEGTWTPFLDASSTDPSITYATQAGAYEKIGAFVHASFFMNVSAVNSQGSGQLRIAGLPFNSSYNVNASEVPAVLLQTEPFNAGDGAGYQQFARTQGNSNALLMGYKTGNGSASIPSGANNVGTGYLIGHIVYRTLS